MSSPRPTRSSSDLADMVEMLLDKGVVVNADIAVSVGDTELLGVEIRAAVASFETAAEYGLEFPAGTDMEKVERAAGGRSSLESGAGEEEDDAGDAHTDHPSRRPAMETAPETTSDDDGEREETDGED